MSRYSSEPPVVGNRKCQDILWDSIFTMNESTLENLSKRGKGRIHIAGGCFFAWKSQPTRVNYLHFYQMVRHTHAVLILEDTLAHLCRHGAAAESSVAQVSPVSILSRCFPSSLEEHLGFQVGYLQGLKDRTSFGPIIEQMGCACSLGDFVVISVTKICIIFRTNVLNV